MADMRPGCGYLRKSTEDSGISTATQRFHIEEYCKQNNIVIPPHLWFIDEDTSGAKPFMKRPGSSALMLAASEKRNREFVVCVFYCLDRLNRDLFDQMLTLKSLEDYNVMPLSTKEDLTDPSPEAKLMLHIIGAFSDHERRKTGVRIFDHNLKRHHAGLHAVGRPPLGFRINDNRTLKGHGDGPFQINEEEAARVIRLFQVYADTAGNSSATTRQLNIEGVPSSRGNFWTPSSVLRTLLRPQYRQAELFAGIIVDKPANIPPLVPTEILERVEPLLTAQYGGWRTPRVFKTQLRNHKSYTGLLVCGECGQGLVLNSPGNDRSPNFRCSTRLAHNPSPVMRQTFHANTLDILVRNAIRQGLQSCADSVNRVHVPLKVKAVPVETKIKKLQFRRDKFVEMYASGTIDWAKYSKEINDIDKELSNLTAVASADKAPLMQPATAASLIDMFEDTWELAAYNNSAKRELMVSVLGIPKGGIIVSVQRASDSKRSQTEMSVEVTALKLSAEPIRASITGIHKPAPLAGL